MAIQNGILEHRIKSSEDRLDGLDRKIDDIGESLNSVTLSLARVGDKLDGLDEKVSESFSGVMRKLEEMSTKTQALEVDAKVQSTLIKDYAKPAIAVIGTVILALVAALVPGSPVAEIIKALIG